MKYLHLALDDKIYKQLKLISVQIESNMTEIAQKAIGKYLEELSEQETTGKDIYKKEGR